jgi:hypothetical protein
VLNLNIGKFKNRKTPFAIALLLLLSLSAALSIVPSASAHTPAWSIPTYAYVTAEPSPIGVNPSIPIVIVFWLDIPPPTANSPSAGDRWRGMTIDITKPDGVTHVKKTGLVSDAIGSSYTTYTPDVTGTYNVTFTFPGQTLQRNGGSDSIYINDTYLPSSATTQFVVQANPVTYFVEASFPSSYWTRPIDANNQMWAAIASNWLGSLGSGQGGEFGHNYLKYNPYGRAPSSAHVMWTYPLTWGGIVGGGNAISSTMSYYSGTQYQLKFANPIIMYGKVFFSLPANTAPTGNGITCIDLRTGETLWTNPNIQSLTVGQEMDHEDPNQHGTTPYLWATGTILGTSSSNPATQATDILHGTFDASVDIGQYSARNVASTTGNLGSGWMAIDPQTGKVLFNETAVPSGTRAYGPMGEWLMYNIYRSPTAAATAPYTNLWSWNNTRIPGDHVGGTWTGPWTQAGSYTNYNMSASYDWNVTLDSPLYPTQTSIGALASAGFGGSASLNATTGLYLNNPTILRVFPGNCILGQSSGLQGTPGTSYGVFGTPDNWEIWCINLDPTRAAIGHVMWDRKYAAPPNNLTVAMGPADGDSMVWTTWYKESMQWSGYSLLTGDYLWTTPSESTWNFYTGSTGLTNPVGMGYGHLYTAGYSGVVTAYNLTTGAIAWTYGNNPADPNNSTITPETTYGDFPTQVAAIANNKVYLIEEEHSLNAPPYHGAMTRCVDAFSGKELWKVYEMSSWQQQAVADGYWTNFNFNDQQVYCFGPGPSSTTVTSNPGVVSLGNGVEITGTVLDQSPNTKLKGTAAISDVDQGLWMEYMVQNSIDRPNVNGVTVSLTAIDQSGTPTELGTVTSDSIGLFHKLWVPKAEGEYTIYASFGGSDSYGPSSASTAIGVTAGVTPITSPTATPTLSPTATPTTPAPTTTAPEPGNNNLTYVYVAIAAVIIVVVIAAAAVMLRRRK